MIVDRTVLRRGASSLVAAGALVALAGCALPDAGAGPGFVLTDTSEAVSVTQSQDGPNVGRACTENYLGIVNQGDASVRAAKLDGEISEVTSMDREIYSILGVYARTCTIVRGR